MGRWDGDDWVYALGEDDDDDEPFWQWMRRTLWLAARVFVASSFIPPVADYIWSFMHYAVPTFR